MAEISVKKMELNSFGRFSVILAWAETFRRHRVDSLSPLGRMDVDPSSDSLNTRYS
jgi:hypothetical protein